MRFLTICFVQIILCLSSVGFAQAKMHAARRAIVPQLAQDQILQLREQIVQARYADDTAALLNPKESTTKKQVLSQIRAGDILFLRSGNFVGSLVARTSDVPGQFAHLAFIVEDPQTHELKAIEAEVGAGVQFISIKEAIAGRARIAVFRYQDPVVSTLVAKKFEQLVREKLKLGKIPYDNMIDNKDHSALTCTEIVSYAYAQIGMNDIPMYPSHLDMFSPEVKQKMGLRSPTFFTPQDLEIDPRFQLIAEWRDITKLQKVYHDDAIFGKFFTWLRTGELKLEPDYASSLLMPILRRQITIGLGYPETAEQEAGQMVRYGISVYFYIQLLEKRLNFELLGNDTSKFQESDYEQILEKIKVDDLTDHFHSM